MLTARKGLDGHAVYGRVRNATELLELLGLDGDDAGRDDRIRCLRREAHAAEHLSLLLQHGFSYERLHLCGYSFAEMAAVTVEPLDPGTCLPRAAQLAKWVGGPIDSVFALEELKIEGKRDELKNFQLLADLLPNFWALKSLR